MAQKTIIGLAGNPNCGTTTLFNALTGSNGYVGNWPGVTVIGLRNVLSDAEMEEKLKETGAAEKYSA